MIKIQKLNYNGIDKRIKNTMKEVRKECKKYISKFGEENFDNFYETKEYIKLSNKVQKAFYLQKNYSSFDQMTTDHLVNAFRQQEDYDSWLDVYIFNTTDIETVEKELDDMYVQLEGSTWYSDYDCTGRPFYRPCRIFQLENRTFVTQSGGLDV